MAEKAPRACGRGHASGPAERARRKRREEWKNYKQEKTKRK